MYNFFHCFNHQFTFNFFCYIIIFHYVVCGRESHMEAAWYLSDEGTIISTSTIDINTAIS